MQRRLTASLLARSLVPKNFERAGNLRRSDRCVRPATCLLFCIFLLLLLYCFLLPRLELADVERHLKRDAQAQFPIRRLLDVKKVWADLNRVAVGERVRLVERNDSTVDGRRVRA